MTPSVDRRSRPSARIRTSGSLRGQGYLSKGGAVQGGGTGVSGLSDGAVRGVDTVGLAIQAGVLLLCMQSLAPSKARAPERHVHQQLAEPALSHGLRRRRGLGQQRFGQRELDAVKQGGSSSRIGAATPPATRCPQSQPCRHRLPSPGRSDPSGVRGQSTKGKGAPSCRSWWGSMWWRGPPPGQWPPCSGGWSGGGGVGGVFWAKAAARAWPRLDEVCDGSACLGVARGSNPKGVRAAGCQNALARTKGRSGPRASAATASPAGPAPITAARASPPHHPPAWAPPPRSAA
jgi:hypothetical protein